MDQLEDLIGDEDDPYEVFADVCKLDLLELLNQKDDSGTALDLDASGELQSRTEQIKVSDTILLSPLLPVCTKVLTIFPFRIL